MVKEWDDEFYVIVDSRDRPLGRFGFGDDPPIVFWASVIGKTMERDTGLRCVPVKIVVKD
jgi:hypothetical protein